MSQAAMILRALEASPPRFDPGRVVMTPGAIAALANNNALVSTYVIRHVSGDWGKCDLSDSRQNNAALKSGLRILSAYELPKGDTIWVITDAVDVQAGDSPIVRQTTTVLLPDEY
jgi:hypothetical protein